MSKKGEVCNSLTVSLQHWEYQSIFQFRAVRQMRQKIIFCRISFFSFPHLPHHTSCHSFSHLWLLSFLAVFINTSSPFFISFTLFNINSRSHDVNQSFLNCSTTQFQGSAKVAFQHLQARWTLMILDIRASAVVLAGGDKPWAAGGWDHHGVSPLSLDTAN